MKLVFRYRVKSLNGLLNRQARKVNFVWNYCNDRQKDALRFNRPWLSSNTFRVFYSRPLPDGKITDGSNFSRDRRGNWYLNIAMAVAEAHLRWPVRGVGIDLGLKDLAKLSDGAAIEAPGSYRAAERALGKAQRARKRKRVQALHAKIANKRRDFLHNETRKLITKFDHVVVGNVNASGLAKTSMAKSVYDVSWSTFRAQLAYKAVKHGAWFQEVDERFTTQICSNCGSLPDSRPKGIADLGIREWRCSDCGTLHDRDLNAAKNILRRGRATLGVGISFL